MSTRIPPLRSTGQERPVVVPPTGSIDHVHVADVVLEPAGVVKDVVGAEPGDEIPDPARTP